MKLIAKCERKSGVEAGPLVRLTFHPDVKANELARARAKLAVFAVLPGSAPLHTPEDWDLSVDVRGLHDSSVITADLLNEKIAALDSDPVVGIGVGQPGMMQVLVAVKYVIRDVHRDHLERVLRSELPDLVLAVSVAQPEWHFQGCVFSLLVPTLLTASEQLDKAVRGALSFDFEKALATC